MKEEDKYQEFKDKYPLLFTDYPRCGFHLLKGWVGIVDQLCQSLTRYIEEGTKITVEQVKEKFGGLRFYVSVDTPDDRLAKRVYNTISNVEYASMMTCESCGTTLNVTTEPRENSFWIVTMCKSCR